MTKLMVITEEQWLDLKNHGQYISGSELAERLDAAMTEADEEELRTVCMKWLKGALPTRHYLDVVVMLKCGDNWPNVVDLLAHIKEAPRIAANGLEPRLPLQVHVNVAGLHHPYPANQWDREEEQHGTPAND